MSSLLSAPAGANPVGGDALERFHPAVAEWFRRRFPAGPTEAQALGWASIAGGEDTLVAAPTGSGKTLAAFLVAIDRAFRTVPSGGERHGTTVVYVSPLRALTVDVAENLEGPLREIETIALELGCPVPKVKVAVRNGDTPPSARAAMLRDRPEIVVTTPESLYLLVTAQRGRELLAGVETVIVDEIHALARDKRGAHLALTLERLDACITAAGGGRPTRIGLSATQRPIQTVARLLVGAGPTRDAPGGGPRCSVVDVGHRRPLDVAIELTGDELGAVTTTDQLNEVVVSLAEHIRAHRTTLVFVNTRRMAERLAHLLSEPLGEDVVAAHHGSLSTERRLSVESRLRAGELRGVVATASLELGIDVGPVDLVCQLGSPRSIATFLQRVGRAEHRLDGVPKGRLYPLTRDELVECVALLAAVAQGRLDAVVPSVAPLDILAQQLVAECAAAGEEGLAEKDLLELVRRAAPFSELSDEVFEEVVSLVSEGVTTGRGVRGAHLHRDLVNGRLRARRGARITATTSGGAIPELADYKVVAEPDEAVVGTIHEDFAVESVAGDVFLLGSTSWRVLRVETGVVRVVDANGAAPTLPFWLGEAPARTDELADAVSELRALVEEQLSAGGPPAARAALEAWSGVTGRPADEVIAYLATAWKELGVLPTKQHLVLERFFDDTGGMQLVLHSPYGGRVNRGLGLALRKRFCRSFDFELQAAAGDDAVVLSLGPQHAFPLEEVTRYLAPQTVREVLIQAVLPTPIFTSRWRWNLSRSLISPRFRGARHLPPAIQRMEADDLMAAIFPMLAACQENVTGPLELPEHPIVRQTVDDCCTEAMDLEGLTKLVGAVRSGEVAVRCIETVEPSVLAHEILNGRPYTFLDDAPLEERRTRSVSVRRGLPLEAHDLSALDPEVIAEVVAEVAPEPRDPEELHDLLLAYVVLSPSEAFEEGFDQLVTAGRASRVSLGSPDASILRWCATERRREVEALWPNARFPPDVALPAALAARDRPEPEQALEMVVRGHLELAGPVTAFDLAEQIGELGEDTVERGLVSVEARGGAVRVLGDRWCARRLAARIHARKRGRERRAFPPVSAQDLMRFLLEWQHVTPGRALRGAAGLVEVVDQLQGWEAPVGAWEESILSARIRGYSPTLLDECCAAGEVAWGRLSARPVEADGPARRAGASPSRATPVSLVRRQDLAFLIAAERGDTTPAEPGPGAAGDVLEVLRERGALFFAEICQSTGRLPVEVGEALWDGVARGWLTADGFAAVRSLLAGRYRSTSSHPARRPLRPLRSPLRSPGGPSAGMRGISPALAGGRWSLLGAGEPVSFDSDDLAEALVGQLLARWGVVFRDLATREASALPWRDLLWALRRLEARGVVRGGRFVGGLTGEQFGLPEAVDHL
ncbi:MAG: associated domain protein, partial [Acidimicrobiaceae bacterium]|nr:associated domain protein [Acidimicrobiaceae bacterium]